MDLTPGQAFHSKLWLPGAVDVGDFFWLALNLAERVCVKYTARQKFLAKSTTLEARVLSQRVGPGPPSPAT